MKALAWQNGIYDWGGIEIEINNLIFSLQTICRNFVSGLPARTACHTSILSLFGEREGERRRRWLCFHRLCLFLMRWRRSSISSHLLCSNSVLHNSTWLCWRKRQAGPRSVECEKERKYQEVVHFLQLSCVLSGNSNLVSGSSGGCLGLEWMIT